MRNLRAIVGAASFALALAGSTSALGAQDTGRARPPAGGRARAAGRQMLPPIRPGLAGRGGRAAAAAEGRQGGLLTPEERQNAVRMIRQAMNRRIRTQLNLSNEQFRTLQSTEQKYDRQRNDLQKQERETRIALRTAMLDSTRDQAKIGGYLDQLTQAQRKRADLLEAEQKELSNFLTPMQRAEYLGLKENLAKRIQQFNQQSGAVAAPGAKPDTTKPPER